MVENSNNSSENEIYKVDSPSNKDSKDINFCQGRMGEKFRGNGQRQGNLLLCNLGNNQLQLEILASIP